MKTGDVVRINQTGQIGFISKAEEERVTVRIPSNTDWPYPSYVHTYKEHLTKISTAKQEELEEALF